MEIKKSLRDDYINNLSLLKEKMECYKNCNDYLGHSMYNSLKYTYDYILKNSPLEITEEEINSSNIESLLLVD